MFGRSQCDQARDLLSPYIDGRLGDADLLKVELHLRDCEACAGELESLRTTVSLLRSTAEVRPPRSFVLQEWMVRRQARPGMVVLRWSTAMAAVLLLLVVGFDTLSSISFEGALAPQTAQKTFEQRSAAQSTESAGAATQNAPPAMPAAVDPAKGTAESLRSVPGADAPKPGAPTDQSAGPSTRESGQTGEVDRQQDRKPGEGLTALQLGEIGLAALVVVLGTTDFVLRRRSRNV